jgi:DNA replication and repair protein RecF
VQHGERIFEYRKRFFAEFLPIFKEIYLYITEGKEQPGISYQADQDNGPLQELLNNSRQKDCILERTGCGIHKDDLEFTLNEMSLKKFASQGQQKSFLISLKLAQIEYLRLQLKINPLLLLDDLYDKVDDSRVTRLLEWLKDHPAGQVFISDTHIDRIPEILRQMHIASENWHISNATATKL